MMVPEMTNCTKCKVEKPVTLFRQQSASGDGIHSWCKDCANEAARNYNSRPDVRLRRQSYLAQWKAANRDRILNYNLLPQERERKRIAARYSRERFPEHQRARHAVLSAVRSCRLVRPKECERCGSAVVRSDGVSAIHAHHYRGYRHPLDIVWLCVRCHSKENHHD